MQNPFRRVYLRLHTPLSPAACSDAIREQLVPWRDWAAWLQLSQPEGKIHGRVSDQGFSIQQFNRFRTGAQTEARGRFTPTSRGTTIDLSLGMSRWAIACYTAALAIASLAVLTLLVGGLVAGGRFAWEAILAWLGFLLWLGGVLLFSLRLARGERDWLLTFLRDDLQAEIVGPDLPDEKLLLP